MYITLNISYIISGYSVYDVYNHVLYIYAHSLIFPSPALSLSLLGLVPSVHRTPNSTSLHYVPVKVTTDFWVAKHKAQLSSLITLP